MTNGGFLDSGYTLVNTIDNITGTLRLRHDPGKPIHAENRQRRPDQHPPACKNAGQTVPLNHCITSRLFLPVGGVSISFTSTNGTVTTQALPTGRSFHLPADFHRLRYTSNYDCQGQGSQRR